MMTGLFRQNNYPDPATGNGEAGRFSEVQAIATGLQRELSAQQITVRTALKDDCLGILLEAAVPPEANVMIPQVQQHLLTVQPQSIRSVRVYGQRKGQQFPVWRHTIRLEAIAPSDAALSLADWLSQGDVNQSLDSPATLASANHQSARDAHWSAALPSRPSDDDRLPETTGIATPEPAAERFLRFYFTAQETALLPLDQVKEVLKVATASVLPVPHMPGSVLGVYNYRGEILWLIDLTKRLGVKPSPGSEALVHGPTPPSSLSSVGSGASSAHSIAHPLIVNALTANALTANALTVHAISASHLHPSTAGPQSLLTVIVLETEDQRFGLVVPHVIDIESHRLQTMQPPSSELFTPNLLPFIKGYLTRSSSPVLKVQALLYSSDFQNR